MDWRGIDEKLKRADENIRNLDLEIKRFFQESKYPILPQDNRETLLQAIAYHKERRIPLRFSVLIGEIVHHLRSSFDHVAWSFSSDAYRTDSRLRRKIEFPIFKDEPIDENSVKLLEGKIKGIANKKVRDLILEVQPYKTSNPGDCPLWLIHDLDVTDKHRELVLCVSSGRLELPMRYKDLYSDLSPADRAVKLKHYGKVIPQVSFRNFGGRKVQPVVPSLHQLCGFAKNTIRRFGKLG